MDGAGSNVPREFTPLGHHHHHISYREPTQSDRNTTRVNLSAHLLPLVPSFFPFSQLFLFLSHNSSSSFLPFSLFDWAYFFRHSWPKLFHPDALYPINSKIFGFLCYRKFAKTFSYTVHSCTVTFFTRGVQHFIKRTKWYEEWNKKVSFYSNFHRVRTSNFNFLWMNNLFWTIVLKFAPRYETITTFFLDRLTCPSKTGDEKNSNLRNDANTSIMESPAVVWKAEYML